MPAQTVKEVAKVLRDAARPISGVSADYDPLMALIGEARFVLLGEASHGTHEFYRERAQITRRLIKEKGFTAVAVEADWPPSAERKPSSRSLEETSAGACNRSDL